LWNLWASPYLPYSQCRNAIKLRQRVAHWCRTHGPSVSPLFSLWYMSLCLALWCTAHPPGPTHWLASKSLWGSIFFNPMTDCLLVISPYIIYCRNGVLSKLTREWNSDLTKIYSTNSKPGQFNSDTDTGCHLAGSMTMDNPPPPWLLSIIIDSSGLTGCRPQFRIDNSSLACLAFAAVKKVYAIPVGPAWIMLSCFAHSLQKSLGTHSWYCSEPKLCFTVKYAGPYEIVAKPHLNVYMLKWLTSFVAHLIFHVSKLKLFPRDKKRLDKKQKMQLEVVAKAC